MNNPLPDTAKFSAQMCQRKQTDGVTVVVKNTAEDFEAAKASHKSKNRLETKHFKAISGRGRRLRPPAGGPGRGSGAHPAPHSLPLPSKPVILQKQTERLSDVRSVLSVLHQTVSSRGFYYQKVSDIM